MACDEVDICWCKHIGIMPCMFIIFILNPKGTNAHQRAKIHFYLTLEFIMCINLYTNIFCIFPFVRFFWFVVYFFVRRWDVDDDTQTWIYKLISTCEQISTWFLPPSTLFTCCLFVLFQTWSGFYFYHYTKYTYDANRIYSCFEENQQKIEEKYRKRRKNMREMTKMNSKQYNAHRSKSFAL